MEFWEAIQIYVGREVDFIDEVVLMSNDNNTYIFKWNIPDTPQPTTEQINEIISNNTSYNDNFYMTLDDLKLFKIKELSVLCEQDIYNGFFSNTKDNTEKFYSFDEKDQMNMSGKIANLSIGINKPIRWKGKFDLESVEWTKEEFIQLCADAEEHRTQKMLKFHQLRVQILNSTTKLEIYNIKW